MNRRRNAINAPLAASASLSVFVIVLIGVYFTDALNHFVEVIRQSLRAILEWYYVAIVAYLLLFVSWLGIGRYRNVRLGQDDEKPEFRTFSWLAMLFAAGTGVGLIFWSIAEPIRHFSANPFSSNESAQAATVAMRLTFFHWGLNGWAIFSTVALILAYFGFRQQRPLTISATLFRASRGPLQTWLAYVVDLFAVLATVFGVVTTLGLGAGQMNAGVSAITGTPASITQQLWIIAIVTMIATLSVVMGLRKGVRVLSVANMWLTFLLLGFFLLFGPFNYQMALLVQSLGAYLQNLIEMSFWTDSNKATDWQSRWTVFFWGWWIAWSPFVGMFIARISRGRTIGEFIFGVMLVPSLFSFFWIAVFGGTALNMELFGSGGVIDAVNNDVTQALFKTIDLMSVSDWLAILVMAIATILIATYFITSADSGTLVISTLLCNGHTDPPRWLRLIWGIGLGGLAAVLLKAGGVETLQSAVISAALPFSLVIILMTIAFTRALQSEPESPRRGKSRSVSYDPLNESSDPPEQKRQEGADSASESTD